MTFNQHSKERTFICVFSVSSLEKKMVILIVTSDRDRERECVWLLPSWWLSSGQAGGSCAPSSPDLTSSTRPGLRRTFHPQSWSPQKKIILGSEPISYPIFSEVSLSDIFAKKRLNLSANHNTSFITYIAFDLSSSERSLQDTRRWVIFWPLPFSSLPRDMSELLMDSRQAQL